MDWYYAESGRQVGPIQEQALEALVSSGTVRPDTLVWRQGMANWQPYGSVRPVAPPQPPPPQLDAAATIAAAPTRFCSECGRPFPQSELIPFGNTLVCATCKETFAHKLREGVGTATAVRYAGFWTRFVAIIIDGAILATVSILLNSINAMLFFRRGMNPIAVSSMYLATQGVVFLVNLVIGISYQVYFLTHYSATPGKMALRLKVIPAQGGPISFALAIGRYFAYYLSMFTLGIGYIMAAFDEQKRALHDRVCDTRVIHA